MAALREWPFESFVSAKQRFSVNDICHSSIPIIYPLNLIIDTPEFQRLRDIKQFGYASPLVYPSADHARFIHSLGVYYIAYKSIIHLRDLGRYNGQIIGLPQCETIQLKSSKFEVTSIDMLCVCIAALIHDLGHGPFSHFYEKCLREMGIHEFNHEVMSFLIFEQMLSKHLNLKSALDKFLNEADYEFIRELINPPSNFVSNGEWQLKGRGIEKSFLYDILSNKHTGIDVDKLDYLLRDSKMTNVPIQLNWRNIERLIEGMRVYYDTESNYTRIIYLAKNESEIKSVLRSRMAMHKTVYQHKTSIGAERILLDMLATSAQHLNFVDPDNGKPYTFTKLFKSVSAFVNVTDNDVISQINQSQSHELAKAREVLASLKRREFAKFIASFHISKKLFKEKSDTKSLCIELQRKILECCEDSTITVDDIMVEIVNINSGFGYGKSSLTKLLLFDERKNKTVKPIFVHESFKGELLAYVYVPFVIRMKEKGKVIASAIEIYKKSNEGDRTGIITRKRKSSTESHELYVGSSSHSDTNSSSSDGSQQT